MRKRPAGRTRTPATLLIATLPFVTPKPHGKPHCWTVPPVGGPIEGYIEAEAIGKQYALQFVRWLHANPTLVGMGVLGWIASDIDYNAIDRNGYWVGFFSCIERLLVDAGYRT
ncbi:hypothetical protein [Lysobacter sp. FW306-1B-D06B]|uniref:hypothetical protein n=1 Tax=Lysobacter sp. FW306-1B-D06B TaxID=3140250 RepID=UPI003140A497